MIWTCACSHPNPPEAKVCGGCGASRPTGPLPAASSEEARYRSLESLRAWSVLVDAVVLYARRVATFLAASFLMFLPHYLFQSWQWQADQMVLPPGVLRPLLALALLTLWNTFWTVLMVRLASDEIEGAWEGMGEAVGRLSTSMVLWAVVAGFLVSLAAGLASLLFIIPGVIVAVRLSLTLPVIVCEDLGPIRAMKRSSRLVKGHGWSVFGAYFLLYLVALVAFLALGTVLWVAEGPWMTTRTFFKAWVSGKNMFVQTLLGPVWAIVPTLFYVTLRSRRDEAPPPARPVTCGTIPLASAQRDEP